MRSIRTKFTLLTLCAVIAALGIAAFISILSIKKLGKEDAYQMLNLMCETGAMNLESYFKGAENSVQMVSALVQDNLEEMPLDRLGIQVERVRHLFDAIAYRTNGVLTYYFRIDPEVSDTVEGFWYVNHADLDGGGFQKHKVTDITKYDTNDTSRLVWFTVPKATGKGIWLPPYITDNLNVRVISYNVPVYRKDKFIGVIGIEIDYMTLVHEVEHIRLFESGYAFLLDADRNVIYHPKMNSEQLYEHGAVPAPEYFTSQNARIQYNYDGIDKVAVWRPLSNGMRLYVTVPRSEIDRGWQHLVWDIIIISFVMLALVSAVIMRFTGHLTKPLSDLTEAAKQAGNGNYDFELDYDKDDEVGILTRTFKQLVKYTKEYIRNLNRQVFVDAMTGVKNKGAYAHFIQMLQDKMDASEEPLEFAIGVLDCDDLKVINDTYGHDKGDVYLKAASRLVCHVFLHSPVFRIGGDEFAVALMDEDYQNRDELLSQFRETRERISKAADNPWEQVNITMGLAVYDPNIDTSVIDVSRRADKIMYENKRQRKEERGKKV